MSYANSIKLTVKAIANIHQIHPDARSRREREELGTGDPGFFSTEHAVPFSCELGLAVVLNTSSTHWISNQASSPVTICPEKFPPLLHRFRIILLSVSGTLTSVSAD